MVTISWSFKNLIKIVKQTKTTKILNMGKFYTLSFYASRLVSSKYGKPRAPNRVRNGKIAAGGGQEKTLKRIYELQKQNLNPEQIIVDRHLRLPLHCLGHGLCYSTLSQLFGA